MQNRAPRRPRLSAALLLPALLACAPAFAGPQSTAAASSPTRAILPTEKNLERHVGFLASRDELIKTGGSDLVFIGDSITDGWRSDPQRETFENYFGRYRPYNIGISADQTQHVLWRIRHGELDGLRPKVAVLMIGTNNIGTTMTAPETAIGVKAVIDAIRAKQPAIKILVLGIFPRANRADDPMRALVKTTNEIIRTYADGRTIIYKDIGPDFLEADGSLSGDVMRDYVHPTVKGYEIWAKSIAPVVDQLER